MSGLMDPPARNRWPRAERFRLSPGGVAAEAAYREQIIAARSEPGRSSFDAARAAWSEERGLLPGDGLFLGELAKAPLALHELAHAVEDCGATKTEVYEAVVRLVDAGLVEAFTSPPPEPPPRSW